MKLHVFNPEHDIALAYNDCFFTPPHAGRGLRADLGFIPSLWAEDGDMVLVEDVSYAVECVRHLKGLPHDVVFVTKSDIAALFPEALNQGKAFEVVPWGWDRALRFSLERMGVPASCMPADEQLDTVRNMSSRVWANVLRSRLPVYANGLIPMPREHTSVSDFLKSYCEYYHEHAVVKAPWSSSGRGIRYFEGRLGEQDIGWVQNVIKRQGCVVSEAYCNKVKDFAVEFYAHADGGIIYEGLSVFKTVNGAYAGNVIASEEDKWQMLAKYGVAKDLTELINTIAGILHPHFSGRYSGPFGIDMMILADGFLHPCVELNLRRTMGHVALSISPDVSAPQRLMRIDYTNRYHLRIMDTFENIINNSLITHV